MESAVLSGYFMPFRSPNFAALPHRKESIEFAIKLCFAIFDYLMPRCILTMVTESFRALRNMMTSRSSVWECQRANISGAADIWSQKAPRTR